MPDAPPHAHRGRPRAVGLRRPVTYRSAVLVIGVAYAALTVAVLVGHPLAGLDRYSFGLDLRRHWPDVRPWIATYVVLGQRGPSGLVAAPWVAWQSWRRRNPRPAIRFMVALVLLNATVGAVKLAVGRLGPRATDHVHLVLAGGDIFPSGHTSNAVIVFGVLAWNAARYRRVAVSAAVVIAMTVGLSTIFLDTHWATDVIGGWLAGALILLALPPVVPWTERRVVLLIRWARDRRGRAQRHMGRIGGADMTVT